MHTFGCIVKSRFIQVVLRAVVVFRNSLASAPQLVTESMGLKRSLLQSDLVVLQLLIFKLIEAALKRPGSDDNILVSRELGLHERPEQSN
jgi:hypothetical protein